MSGKQPVDPRFVDAARTVLSWPEQVFELDYEDGNKYFVLNVEGDRRKVTQSRAQAYCDWYDDGELPPAPQQPGKEHFATLHENVLKAVLVTLKPVDKRSELRSWASSLNADLYKALDLDGGTAQLYDASCSCEVFHHNNNACPHVYAVAAFVGIVNLEQLLTVTPTKRRSGRPKKGNKKTDNCRSKDPDPVLQAEKKMRKMLHSGTPMEHRFWQAFLDIPEARTPVVGYLSYCEEAKNGNPKFRKYTITIPEMEGKQVQLTPEQFARGIVRAQRAGVNEPYELPFAPARAA